MTITFNEDYDPMYDELAEETTPGNYSVSRFTDNFGRELEAHRCDYCGEKKPVTVDPFGFGPANRLMRQVQLDDGRIVWRCNDCAVDIINKS